MFRLLSIQAIIYSTCILSGGCFMTNTLKCREREMLVKYNVLKLIFPLGTKAFSC